MLFNVLGLILQINSYRIVKTYHHNEAIFPCLMQEAVNRKKLEKL